MAAILKRFKGRQKSSDKEASQVSATEPKGLQNIEEIPRNGNKSSSLSPSTSDSDMSPQHENTILHGSLFSGMKLTKSARKLEPETSPYINTGTIVDGETSGSNRSGFAFLTQSSNGPPQLDEGTTDPSGSGFSFLNEEPPPLTNEREEDATPTPNDTIEKVEENAGNGNSSGFSFVTSSNIDSNNPADEREGTPTQPTGFSFLSGDSLPDDNNGNQVSVPELVPEKEVDVHSTKTESQSSHSVAKADSHSSIPVALTPPQPSPNSKVHVTQKVGRQAPPQKRKKKHKAIRPGQDRKDEIYSGLMETSVTSDLDGLSLSSHGSSSHDVPMTVEGEDGMNEETLVSKDPVLPPATAPVPSDDVSPVDHSILNANIGDSVVTGGDTGEDSGGTLVNTGKGVSNDKGTLVNSSEENGDPPVTNGDSPVECKVKVEENLVQLGPSLTVADENIFEEAGTPPPREPISSELVEVFSGGANTEPVTEGADTKTAGTYIVELSPVEKMATLLQAAKSNAEAIRADGEETGKQYGTTVERNIEAIKKITSRRHYVKEIKAKETAALSEENYELADDLRQELESLSVGNDWSMLMETQTCVEQWLKQCGTLMHTEIALHAEVKENLERLKEEQSKGLSLMEKEFISAHTKEKMQLQTMRDELERERGHIALDREHLEKRQMLLEDEVTKRASEFIECKRDLEGQEKAVQEEMESLEKKLQELKERQRELLTRISEEDEKIQVVSRELSSEHEQVEKEKAIVEKKEEDLQEQVSSLNKFQLSYDASLEVHNKGKESIQSVIKQSEQEIDKHSESQRLLEEAFAQSKEWSFEDVSELLRPPDSLQSLFDREKLMEEQVKEASTEVLSTRSSIAALSKKISDLEAQLPKLKESKKVAVSARQYREAAKLSSEEKELTAEIEKGKEEVTQMEKDLSFKNDGLGTLNQELEQLKEERREAERESDILCIGKLTTSFKAIKHKISRVPGGSQSPLYTVLQLWTSFHQLLIEDLCTKHELPLRDYLAEDWTEDKTKDGESENGSSSLSKNSENKEKEREKGFTEEVGVKGSGRNTPIEERTPGVGMEEPGNEGGDNGVVKELREKIEELETRIATCCENEEFELAAQLDDELNGMKSKLNELLSD